MSFGRLFIGSGSLSWCYPLQRINLKRLRQECSADTSYIFQIWRKLVIELSNGEAFSEVFQHSLILQ